MGVEDHELVRLYEAGNSIRKVSALTGVPKTSVETRLKRSGVTLRANNTKGMQTIRLSSMWRLAKALGWKFLSKEYLGNQINHFWRCPEGHEVWMQPASLKSGQGCLQCYNESGIRGGSQRLTIKQCREFAVALGGICISNTYKNAFSKMEWQCAELHTWWAIPTTVRLGHWCPTCAHKRSKSELELFQCLKSIFPDLVSGVRKILSINPRYELDIFLPAKKLAIEFDGGFWHSQPGSARRDLLKEIGCIQDGIELLRVSWEDWTLNKGAVINKSILFLSGQLDAPNL